MVNNFIGIFPNAANSEYCERLIHRFEFTKETKSEGRGKVFSRFESEKINKLKKDDSTYFLGGDGRDNLPHTEEDKNISILLPATARYEPHFEKDTHVGGSG